MISTPALHLDGLLADAGHVATLLRQRAETLAVAESSSGGLVSAALLAVPGASAYFLGGAVVYTQAARAVLGITPEAMCGIRSSSEPYARLLARTVRERFAADWGIAETGAAGPSGNRYGDPAGHTCIAVSGPVERVLTVETGTADRLVNMHAFTAAVLTLLGEALAG